MAGDLFMKHAELKIIFPKNSEAAVRASGTNGHSVRIRLHIHAANNVPHAEFPHRHSFGENLAAINQAFSIYPKNRCLVITGAGKM
jgi:hypothetical protein